MATCREAARCPPSGESSTGIQLAGGVVAVNRRKLTYPQLHRAGRPRKGWTGSSFGRWRSIGGGGATSAAQVRLNQVMATATSAAHRWGLRVPSSAVHRRPGGRRLVQGHHATVLAQVPPYPLDFGVELGEGTGVQGVQAEVERLVGVRMDATAERSRGGGGGC
jgi:hypothetical protein